MTAKEFQKLIWAYYRKNKRPMPWRETVDPYRIFVSEIMLQQTQVARVLEKYPHFIKRFSSFSVLAKASPSSVLALWQGLGYNRRALFLKKSAEIIVQDYHGVLPKDFEKLKSLPGIGPGTAGSLMAFAFNVPVVFIETNIRRVFIHYFFPKKKKVSDEMIMPYIAAALDKKSPREWYWALMDHGAMLAQTGENPNRRSKHYTKQKKFEGSLRQVRGAIIRTLLERSSMTSQGLMQELGYDVERTEKALESLCEDGFLVKKRNTYRVA